MKWRDRAYSGYVSKRTLEQIQSKVAEKELEEWIDDKWFIWREHGWPALTTVVAEYARTQEEYARIAERHGGDNAFKIGKRVAMDRLYELGLQDGGK